MSSSYYSEFSPIQWLSAQKWLECHLLFRNTIYCAVHEHPLLIFDAILKYSSHISVHPWPTWYFRPDFKIENKAPLGKIYGLTLIFPNCANIDVGDTAISCIETWLASGRRNFCLIKADTPSVMTLDTSLGLLRSRFPEIDKCNNLCLHVHSPLPFKCNLKWKGAISAAWLGESLVRRVERVFGKMPEKTRMEAIDQWAGKRIIPWYWDYEEHKHISRSTKGTRYLNGFSGPLWLEGDSLQDVLPLVAVGSRLNVGARLSAGQGAYSLKPAKPFLVEMMLREDSWFEPWRELAKRVPGLPPDLPEGVYMRLCESRLDPKDDSVCEHSERLDSLLGIGLYTLMRKAVSRADPEIEKLWYEKLPLFPNNSAFFDVLCSVLPRVDSAITKVLSRFFYNVVQRCRPMFEELDSSQESDLWSPDSECGEAEEHVFQAEAPLRRPCYILRHGVAVSLNNQRIYSRYNGEICGNVPLGHVSFLVLQGAGSVTVPLLRACAKRHIPVIFTSPSGKYQNILEPEGAAWRSRFDEQLRHWDGLSDTGRQRVGVYILMAKIQNYVAWLGQEENVGKSLARSGTTALGKLANISERNSAMGIEGSYAKLCFPVINNLIEIPGFISKRREPRLRLDAWNCLLDTASSLVFNRLCVLLHGEGLSPYRGFLHCQHDRYPTLAADIQELFRARTECWLITILNERKLESKYLQQNQGVWALTREGWPVLMELFEQELARIRFHDHVPWIDIMEEQVRRLRLWCTGQKELSLYSNGTWWEPPQISS